MLGANHCQHVHRPKIYIKNRNSPGTSSNNLQLWSLLKSNNIVSISRHSSSCGVSCDSVLSVGHNNNCNNWQNQTVVLWKDVIGKSCKDGVWWCISCQTNTHGWVTIGFTNILNVNICCSKTEHIILYHQVQILTFLLQKKM